MWAPRHDWQQGRRRLNPEWNQHDAFFFPFAIYSDAILINSAATIVGEIQKLRTLKPWSNVPTRPD
jgi:hypothetical protein